MGSGDEGDRSPVDEQIGWSKPGNKNDFETAPTSVKEQKDSSQDGGENNFLAYVEKMKTQRTIIKEPGLAHTVLLSDSEKATSASIAYDGLDANAAEQNILRKLNTNGKVNADESTSQSATKYPNDDSSKREDASSSYVETSKLPFWAIVKDDDVEKPSPRAQSESDQVAISTVEEEEREKTKMKSNNPFDWLGDATNAVGDMLGGFLRPKKLINPFEERNAPIDDDQEKALLEALEVMNAAGDNEASILEAVELISSTLEASNDTKTNP